MKMGFYMMDDKSENWYVSKFYRNENELKDEMKTLKVGEVLWGKNGVHFERFQ